MRNVQIRIACALGCTLALQACSNNNSPQPPAPTDGESNAEAPPTLGQAPIFDGMADPPPAGPPPSEPPIVEMPVETPAPGEAPGPPAVACGNVIEVPAPSRTIAVHDNLQAALDAAQPGDELVLDAGATYTGNFTLPKKSGAQHITLRSSAMDKLPAPGTRVTPAFSPAMPKIVAADDRAAVATEAGAHHYRFVGIELSSARGRYGSAVVAVGTGVERNVDELPREIIFDRVLVRGDAKAGAHRGITLNGAAITVANSTVVDIKSASQEAQALVGWNGTGPFTIVNNHLEGSAQNLFFGGADPTIANLVPSDITIKHNTMMKPLAWKPSDPSYAGVHWMVKNILELKNARRVLIDGNHFEQVWADGQSGEVVLFTVRNQNGGAPWSVVEDVRFINNVARHAGGGIAILGHDNNYKSQLAHDFVIRNNAFSDVGGSEWGGWGRFLTIVSGTNEAGPANVTADHNTVIQAGDVIASSTPSTGVQHPGFVFTNNVAQHNGLGVWGQGTKTGDATLETYFAGAQFTGNVLVGGPAAAYAAHPGNSFPAAMADSFAGAGADQAALVAAAACRLVATP